jgi:predicted transcriptional regulator
MTDDSAELDGPTGSDIIGLSAAIVSAYVAKNILPSRDLPGLLMSVHATLAGLGNAAATSAKSEIEVEKPSPAQIRKSITPDALTSFIDGRPYKTLKRHLGTHGLDPFSYRERYGLPRDYPMTAPSYSERRSALAKSLRLGRGFSDQ